jgi:hypothetical protein
VNICAVHDVDVDIHVDIDIDIDVDVDVDVDDIAPLMRLHCFPHANHATLTDTGRF